MRAVAHPGAGLIQPACCEQLARGGEFLERREREDRGTRIRAGQARRIEAIDETSCDRNGPFQYFEHDASVLP